MEGCDESATTDLCGTRKVCSNKNCKTDQTRTEYVRLCVHVFTFSVRASALLHFTVVSWTVPLDPTLALLLVLRHLASNFRIVFLPGPFGRAVDLKLTANVHALLRWRHENLKIRSVCRFFLQPNFAAKTGHGKTVTRTTKLPF